MSTIARENPDLDDMSSAGILAHILDDYPEE